MIMNVQMISSIQKCYNIINSYIKIECNSCHQKGSKSMLEEKTCPYHPGKSIYDDDWMPYIWDCCDNPNFIQQSGHYRWGKGYGKRHNGCTLGFHKFERICKICKVKEKMENAKKQGSYLSSPIFFSDDEFP